MQGRGAAFLSMSFTTLSSALDISGLPVVETNAAQAISLQARQSSEPWQADRVRVLPVLSTERFEQRFGLLEVGSLEALGEPAVNVCQQLSSLFYLALFLQQTTQAHRCP
jgi:hypothetical protein